MILFSTFVGGSVLWLFSYLGFVSGLIFFICFRLCNYFSTCDIKIFHLPKRNSEKGESIRQSKLKNNMSLSLAQIVRQKKRERRLLAKQAKMELKSQKEQAKIDKKKKALLNRQEKIKRARNKKYCEKQIKIEPIERNQNLQKKALKEKNKREKKIARHAKVVAIKNRIKNFAKKVFDLFRKIFATLVSLLVLIAVVMLSLYINYNLNFGEVGISSIAIYFFAFFLASKFVKIVANFVLHLYNRGKRKLNEKTI